MQPHYFAVTKVTPLANYRLHICYANGEDKIFDVTPYLDTGKFQELKNIELFNAVKPSFNSVLWPNNIDIDPETLYQNSVKTSLY